MIHLKKISFQDVVRVIGELDTNSNSKPFKAVRIVDSGVVGLEKKYNLNETQLKSDEDLFD